MTRAGTARWAGIGLILWTICVRALSGQCRVPWWDLDPTQGFLPETTLLPSFAFALDAAAWIGIAAVIIGEALLGRSLMWKSGLLVLIGCAGAVVHGWVLTPLVGREAEAAAQVHGDFLGARIGSTWVSAMAGAWALAHAARDAPIRRVILAILTGIVVVLCARGVYQVFVEHLRLLEAFDEQRRLSEGLGVAQRDSTTARIFERRLRQPEATGWFALANVFGSVAAACLVAWVGLALIGISAANRRAIGSGEAGLAWLAALASATACALSGSKGAMVAAGLGLAILLAATLAVRFGFRRRSVWAWSGIVLCAAALGAVTLRGLVGERFGELSLLFRWQYLVGATRIIADHWLLGVGPAGFKDAYMMVRLPIAPEEVESPHSLVFDWVATLGAFGIAWVLVWTTWLWRCGDSLARVTAPEQPRPTSDASDARSAMRVAALVPIATVAASLFVEWPALGADLILLLLLAGIVWAVLAIVGLRLAASDMQGTDRACSAAAVVLAVHSMIEVTGMLPGSIGWVLAVLAVAGASAIRAPIGSAWPQPRASRSPGFTVAAIAAAFFALCAFGAVKALRWEAPLKAAAVLAGEATAHVREARLRGEAPARGVDATLLERAAASLLIADSSQPSVVDSSAAAARLLLHAATIARSDGDSAREKGLAERAAAAAAAGTKRLPGSARAWGVLAGALEMRATVMGDDFAIESAREAWLRAAERDPQGIEPALRLWNLALRAGDSESVRQWGQRVLELDANMRLDPLKRLTPEQRGGVRSNLGKPSD